LYFRYGPLQLSLALSGQRQLGVAIGDGIQKRLGLLLPGFSSLPIFMRVSLQVGREERQPGSA